MLFRSVTIIGLTPYLTDVVKKAAVVLQKVFKFVDDLDMSTLEPGKTEDVNAKSY